MAKRDDVKYPHPLPMSERKEARYSRKFADLKFPHVTFQGYQKWECVGVGDLISYVDERDGTFLGRILSRVDCSQHDGCPAVNGHLVVATLSHSGTSAAVRWVDPVRVRSIHRCPSKFLAAFFGEDVGYNYMPVSSASYKELEWENRRRKRT